MIGELHLATGFGEALENLGIKLIAPIYLISARRSLDHNVIVTKIEAAKQDKTRRGYRDANAQAERNQAKDKGAGAIHGLAALKLFSFHRIWNWHPFLRTFHPDHSRWCQPTGVIQGSWFNDQRITVERRDCVNPISTFRAEKRRDLAA